MMLFFQVLSEDIDHIFSSGGSMAFTTDMWTDDYKQRSYTTVTGHYIEDWKLRNRVLITEEYDSAHPKTAENLRQQLNEIFLGYGLGHQRLEKVIFTTDKGSNIISALKDLDRIDCINHVLNRVIVQCFEEAHSPKDVSELISTVKELVRFVKKNSFQNLLPTTLKQCNATRWNSIYNMLKSVLDNFEELQKLFALHKPSELRRITAINIDLLKELVDFLAPFNFDTKFFEDENRPTLHLVIPKITKLKKHCEISENDSSSLKSVKEKALLFILSKFTPHILHKVAVFLNPRQKSMRVLEEEDRDLVLNYVNEKIDALPLNSYQSKRKASSPPPLNKARYDVDEFDDVPQKGDKLSEVESYQRKEVPCCDK